MNSMVETHISNRILDFSWELPVYKYFSYGHRKREIWKLSIPNSLETQWVPPPTKHPGYEHWGRWWENDLTTRFHRKPPMESLDDLYLYSKVSSSMESITGQATVVRFRAIRSSRASSQPAKNRYAYSAINMACPKRTKGLGGEGARANTNTRDARQ